MKLAIFTRRQEPFSQRIYRENIVRELITCGIEVLPFTEDNPIPKACDLVWEPGLAGSGLPNPIFKNTQIPLVVTVHGAGPFILKWHEIYPSLLLALRGKFRKMRTLNAWQLFRQKVSAVIAVSKYGAHEISHVFNLPPDIVHYIYHGINHDIFHIEGNIQSFERDYLLHVSQYKPKKNIERVFSAYAKLPQNSRPDLVVILPGYNGKNIDIKGLKLISDNLTPIELAKWYRGGIGFVFPSLHETFGLPILEAMACGCPVITSNVSACPEVAGDAALLVNPRSIDDIASVMKRLVEDESLRQLLRQRGLARSQQFTWRKSAEEHIKVFKKMLGKKI